MPDNIQNIIEINGRRFDAVSGTYLGAHSTGTPAESSQKRGVGRPKAMAVPHQSVDGFRRLSSASMHAQPSPLTPTKVIHRPAAPLLHGIKTLTKKPAPMHVSAAHVAAHHPERSHTLMRSAVTKPHVTSPAHLKANGRTDILVTTPKVIIAPKPSSLKIDPSRMKRAHRIIQSQFVSRYGNVTAFAPTATVATALPVSASNQHITPHARHQHSRLATAQPSRLVDILPATPPPLSKRATLPAQHQNSQDMFTRALANATSHEQKYFGPQQHAPKKVKLARATVAAVFALLVIGFIAYLNVPRLNMRVAIARSGVSAHLPTYQPYGYTRGNLAYSSGTVNVSYKSKTAGSSYAVSQKTTGLNSRTLLTNYLAPNHAYDTYQQAGRTIYIYDSSNATWIDNGIWYTISGTSGISTAELLTIAASL